MAMRLDDRIAEAWLIKASDAEAQRIWAKLTKSMRATLLDEAGLLHMARSAPEEAQIRAGLRDPNWVRIEHPSNSARKALGKRGLLNIGETEYAPKTFTGWHTKRSLTPLGERVAQHALSLLSST